MTFKRVLGLLVVLLAALAIAACTEDPTADNPGASGDAEPDFSDLGEVEGEGSVEEGGELGSVEVESGEGGLTPTAGLEEAEPSAGGDTVSGETLSEAGEAPAQPLGQSVERLIDELTAQGVTVEVAGEVQDPDLVLKGLMLMVNGQEVQVYQYESEQAAAERADEIAEGVTGTELDALLTPQTYVFHDADLIVLYSGGSEDVYGALAAVLGQEVGEAG